MEENGEKILGYDKKLVIRYALWVAIALVAFYAGAKYEKHKLESLHLLKNSANENSQDPATKKMKKPKVEETLPPTETSTPTAPVVETPPTTAPSTPVKMTPTKPQAY